MSKPPATWKLWERLISAVFDSSGEAPTTATSRAARTTRCRPTVARASGGVSD